MQDVYYRLAEHLGNLVMGFPLSDPLVDLLKETYTPTQAQVLLAIPDDLAPLETAPEEQIIAASGLPAEEAAAALKTLGDEGLLFTRALPGGGNGYALLQVGYGIPQTFLWAGRTDERTKKMAGMLLKYFTVDTTRRVYAGRPTKTYRYSPASLSVDIPMQGVFSNEMMEPVIAGAEKIAVAHCPCRMTAKLLGRTDCRHSLEVCLKYDELAEFVIDKGLARQISADEAMKILEASEQEGLVHMVDNVQGGIKHTCNCCGCYCWNVGIIRRKKVPRDQLMAAYYIRETKAAECIGCGYCIDVCPVDALELVDDVATVDTDWCIGCGVCAVGCPTDAISLKRRTDQRPPESFADMMEQLRQEPQAG